ncbi:MAG: methionyl-tRNA formyltransferase [Oscillospiraceae bacterium]|nr:methionyl-tRNA formyltransferase [Oscillospiraceae bacterium]
MRVIFMGTPDFSVPCLEALIKNEDVVGVFTQPDKPKGRGYELTPPPVKVCAEKYNIPVFQPASMRNGKALEIINSLEAELIIVVAFGKILPKEILESVKYGCINIHASLLPRLRGSAPIQWSIINGEETTGVTSMQMDEGIDTGDWFIKKTLPITENMNAGELHDALSVLGAELLTETIDLLKVGALQPHKQDDSLSNYAPMLSKELCPVDFSDTAKNIHNKIRGLYPWPVATTKLSGKVLKIHESRLSDIKTNAEAGKVVSTENGICVACGDGNTVLLKSVQLEGKKRMSYSDFLRGHPIEKCTVLGR